MASLSFSLRESDREDSTVFAKRNPIPDNFSENLSCGRLDFSRESACSLSHFPHDLSRENLSNPAASDFNIASNHFLDNNVSNDDTSFENSEPHSLQLLESCFLGEISATEFKVNADFDISSERSLFTDSSADVSTVCLTQLDDRETVSFLVHFEKQVDLLPG